MLNKTYLTNSVVKKLSEGAELEMCIRDSLIPIINRAFSILQ